LRLVDTGHSLHVGARGPTYEKRALDAAIERQYGVIPGVELRSRGIPDVLREIRERMAGRPVYLCFDMDFFDPSCAPGATRHLPMRSPGLASKGSSNLARSSAITPRSERAERVSGAAAAGRAATLPGIGTGRTARVPRKARQLDEAPG
jgi:hypothetical protein